MSLSFLGGLYVVLRSIWDPKVVDTSCLLDPSRDEISASDFIPAWSGCSEYLANVPPLLHSETRADIANQSQHSFLLSAEMVLGY